MHLIGITGGIGMGKSTSASLLGGRGFPVADTDLIAREVVEPGTPGLAAIRESFGDEVVDDQGRLRRGKLAAIVFAHDDRRKELEAITHPLIRRRWETVVTEWHQRKAPIGFVIIPLLHETAAEDCFDEIVCVACSARTQRERLAARDWSPAECERRIAAQMPVDRKMQLASRVVWTEGDLVAHMRQWDLILAALGK